MKVRFLYALNVDISVPHYLLNLIKFDNRITPYAFDIPCAYTL